MNILKNITIAEKDSLQSSVLGLDVSGSNGIDGSLQGVHLRWGLNGEENATHLPTGSDESILSFLTGWKGTGDAFRLYRVARSRTYPVRLLIANQKPSAVTEVGDLVGIRKWEFELQNPIEDGSYSTIVVSFNDTAVYDALREQFSIYDNVEREQFLQNYTGIVEISVKDQLFFNVTLNVASVSGNSGMIKFESISKFQDAYNKDYLKVTNRRTWQCTDPITSSSEILVNKTAIMGSGSGNRFQVEAPNISSIRFSLENTDLQSIEIETYSNFIIGTSQSDTPWQSVGPQDGFALPPSKTAAFDRLNPAIDGKWPRFYNADSESSAFRVVFDNYVERWNVGVENTLKDYLSFQKDNPFLTLKNFIDGKNEGSLATNLQIAALDFHIARMLGLGYIDSMEDNRKYVYLLKYQEEGKSGAPIHYQMSLPLNASDEVFPLAPDVKGISHSTRSNSSLLFDNDGYNHQKTKRLINVELVKSVDLITTTPPFFMKYLADKKLVPDTADYTYHSASEPIFYGVEYRKKGETQWRKKKLHSDPFYQDAEGNDEVAPLIRDEALPIHSHIETEPGEHEYAVYAINIFGRTSELSDPVSVTSTFSPVNQLQPPILESQLIWRKAELDSVFSESDSDKTYVHNAVLIDDYHYRTHQNMDRIEFFYRPNEFEVIKGEIKSVEDHPDDANKLRIQTKDYLKVGTTNPSYPEPDTIIKPEWLGAESKLQNLFSTGKFSSFGQQYQVAGVIKNADNSVTIDIVKKTSVGFNEQNEIVPSVVAKPQSGKPFSLYADPRVISNWNGPLAKTVEIVSLSPQKVMVDGIAKTIKAIRLSTEKPATQVVIEGELPASVTELTLKRRLAARVLAESNLDIAVKGNLVDLLSGKQVNITDSQYSNGSYSISQIVFDSDSELTLLTLNGNISKANTTIVVEFEQTFNSADNVLINSSINGFEFDGQYADDFFVTHSEPIYYGDSEEDSLGGSQEDMEMEAVGGLFTSVDITPKFETNDKDETYFAGEYTLSFPEDNAQNRLLPDLSSQTDVEWLGGVVRVIGLDLVTKYQFQVVEIDRTQIPMQVVVRDLTLDPNNITSAILSELKTTTLRSGVPCNFYPGYSVFLKAEAGVMDASMIQPAEEENNKISLLSARTVDVAGLTTALVSKIAQPQKLECPQIIEAVRPNKPIGATFATRPDKYFRSSYTMDLGFDKKPWAFVVLRASGIAILQSLYMQDTAESISERIDAVPLEYQSNVWQHLLDMNWDSATGQFTPCFIGEDVFQWDTPNNENYKLPSADFNNLVEVKPFAVGADFTALEMLTYIKVAIMQSFTITNEQPIMFEDVPVGVNTSSRAPVIRDESGILIPKGNEKYDPCPMAVKASDASTTIKYTDYKLDGASSDVWFYCGMGLGNQFDFSEYSEILGPINLINTAAPKKPIVTQFKAIPADPELGKLPSVSVTMRPYSGNEKITKIGLYRSVGGNANISISKMKLVSEVFVDAQSTTSEWIIGDTLSDLEFIPYGDRVFYRVVVFREIRNEANEVEYVVSLPSDMMLCSLMDMFIPEAPSVRVSQKEVGTLDNTEMLKTLTLEWKKTVHNGNYFLYEMTTVGTWRLVQSFKKDNRAKMSHTQTQLPMRTADGLRVRRYKVDVENSSGVRNESSKEITISYL